MNEAKWLGFIWFYSSESGLFNGLQRIQINFFPVPLLKAPRRPGQFFDNPEMVAQLQTSTKQLFEKFPLHSQVRQESPAGPLEARRTLLDRVRPHRQYDAHEYGDNSRDEAQAQRLPKQERADDRGDDRIDGDGDGDARRRRVAAAQKPRERRSGRRRRRRGRPRRSTAAGQTRRPKPSSHAPTRAQSGMRPRRPSPQS